MSLVNGVPNVPTCLAYPMCCSALRALNTLCALRAPRVHVLKYILQTEKLKIMLLMKSNEGLFTDVFKAAEF